MRVKPLGDQAWIVRDFPQKPAELARAIVSARLPGVTDVVPCFNTVGIYGSALLDEKILAKLSSLSSDAAFEPVTHTIPVCYELGEDLETVAMQLGLSSGELTRLHSSAEYECFAIGFCPGFAYLGPLPEALLGIPRRASPRTRTQPGSVGMTGDQTAVYPLLRPGGWPIIGMTPLELVNEAEGYFPISVGDLIKFEALSPSDFGALRGERL